MVKILQLLVHLLVAIILTALTQVGGVVYIFCLLLNIFKKRTLTWFFLLFISFYLLVTFLLVPFIAPHFGRVRVCNTSDVTPTNYITILFNRNYVRPELNDVLRASSASLAPLGIRINYLDANFPFFDGFPLLPHLSHSDGKKLDISLIYEHADGFFSKKQRSFSGYGVFAGPKTTEYSQIYYCKSKVYKQYDYSKYLSFGRINRNLQFSEKGTTKLVNAILANKSIGKVFIEPHLKSRLNLTDPRIRFHGCKAVRHDDHIHVQLK